MKTNLYQYRKFFVSRKVDIKDKSYHLSGKVKIFNEGKVILDFNLYTMNKLDDTKNLELPFEITRKVKLNLNKKDAFIIKSEPKYYSDIVEYDLYIHKDLIELEYIGESLKHTTVYNIYNSYIGEIEEYQRDLSRDFTQKEYEIRKVAEKLSCWFGLEKMENLIAELNQLKDELKIEDQKLQAEIKKYKK